MERPFATVSSPTQPRAGFHLRALGFRGRQHGPDPKFLRNLDQIIGPPTVTQKQGDSDRLWVAGLRNLRWLSYKVDEGLVDPEFVQENRQELLVPRELRRTGGEPSKPVVSVHGTPPLRIDR